MSNASSSIVRKRRSSLVALGGHTAKSVKLNRSIAKAGMIGSIGSLALTGLMRFKGAKTVHHWSGWALVGFSVWHYLQNRRKTKNV